MNKIYSKPNCPNCVEAIAALKKAGIQFEVGNIEDDLEELTERLSVHGIKYSSIKAAPILISETGVFTGYDCVIAVEEGEL